MKPKVRPEGHGATRAALLIHHTPPAAIEAQRAAGEEPHAYDALTLCLPYPSRLEIGEAREIPCRIRVVTARKFVVELEER